MDNNVINLTGKFCPFPIMRIVHTVDSIQKGDNFTFFFDDPLALKSIPEELEEFEGIDFKITKKEKGWLLYVEKK